MHFSASPSRAIKLRDTLRSSLAMALSGAAVGALGGADGPPIANLVWGMVVTGILFGVAGTIAKLLRPHAFMFGTLLGAVIVFAVPAVLTLRVTSPAPKLVVQLLLLIGPCAFAVFETHLRVADWRPFRQGSLLDWPARWLPLHVTALVWLVVGLVPLLAQHHSDYFHGVTAPLTVLGGLGGSALLCVTLWFAGRVASLRVAIVEQKTESADQSAHVDIGVGSTVRAWRIEAYDPNRGPYRGELAATHSIRGDSKLALRLLLAIAVFDVGVLTSAALGIGYVAGLLDAPPPIQSSLLAAGPDGVVPSFEDTTLTTRDGLYFQHHVPYHGITLFLVNAKRQVVPASAKPSPVDLKSGESLYMDGNRVRVLEQGGDLDHTVRVSRTHLDIRVRGNQLEVCTDSADNWNAVATLQWPTYFRALPLGAGNGWLLTNSHGEGVLLDTTGKRLDRVPLLVTLTALWNSQP